MGRLPLRFRRYLMKVGNRQFPRHLQAKGSVDDLVQDAFLQAYLHFGEFRGETGPELLGWLMRILGNRLKNWERHCHCPIRSVAQEVCLDNYWQTAGRPAQWAGKTKTAEQGFLWQEKLEAGQRALTGLKGDHRRVIELRIGENLSFQVIGPLMDRTPDAARQLYKHAVEQFKKAMPE